jgi:hypothetical protein
VVGVEAFDHITAYAAVGLEGAFGLFVRQFVGGTVGAVVDPAGDDGAVRVAFLKINASPFLY